MKKTIAIQLLASIFLISTQYIYSQEDPSLSVPNFSPVSPEAGTIARYDNISTTMHKGQMNFPVDIFNINYGDVNWPVSLNYSYGGLILEGKASLFGLGWNLSAYGVITREVRGLPDEHFNGYYGTGNMVAKVNDFVNNGSIDLLTMRNFRDGKWDAEADVYHVSVGGLQFSYKLDANDVPIFLSQHNNLVTVSTNQITVTDDRGIQYLFNALNAEHNEPSDASPETNELYKTAWNLSQVIFPSGRTIDFSYIPNQYLSYDFYAGGIIGKNGNNYFGAGYTDGINQTIINRKILSKISFDLGEINFEISDINYRKLCTGITVINNNLKTIYDYDLEYTGSRDAMTQIDRNNVLYYGFEYYDQNSLPGFMTNTIDKPLSQDGWKFFNARENSYAVNIPNSSYTANKGVSFGATRKGAMKKIKYPTGGYSIINYKQNQIKQEYTSEAINNDNISFNKQIWLKLQSDDDVSAPFLKEVDYTYTFDQPVVATAYSRIKGHRGGSHLTMTTSRTDTCPIPSAQNPEVSGNYHENLPHFRAVLAQPIPEHCIKLGEEFGPDNSDPTYYDESHNSGGRFIIPAGTYNFKISNDYNKTSDAFGEILIRFFEPNIPSGETTHINVDVGGIRVDNIDHYKADSQKANTQYFDYNDDDGFSTGVLLAEQVITVDYDKTVIGSSGTTNSIYHTYSFNRYTSLNVDQSAPVFYKEVKQAVERNSLANTGDADGTWTGGGNGGPNGPPTPPQNPDGSIIFSIIGSGGSHSTSSQSFLYPQGYTLHEFEFPFENYDYTHPQHPKSQDLSKGREKSMTVYKNFASNLQDSILNQKIQQTNNTYKQFRGDIGDDGQDYNNNHPWSLKIDLKQETTWDCIQFGGGYCDLQPLPELEGWNIDQHDIKPYREIHNSFKIKQGVSTSYVYNTNNTLSGTTVTTNNLYDNYYNLKEVTFTDSNNEITKTLLKYPYDETNPGNQALVNANRISSPVSTEKSRIDGNGEELLNQTLQLFTDIGNNFALPEFVKAAKGTNLLENRVQFHSYYANGNVKEVSATDGSHTVYIWGYNDAYPIAKIENSTYAEIATALGISESALDNFNGTNMPELNGLRNSLPNAMVTTYTFDPLIGVLSITDPKSYTMFYEYDDLNRLKQVKDDAGNILSNTEYHYKDQ